MEKVETEQVLAEVNDELHELKEQLQEALLTNQEVNDIIKQRDEALGKLKEMERIVQQMNSFHH